MSNSSLNDQAVSRLASQSDAVGRLAQDSGGFAAVVAAFESKDANAFRWVLERLEMLPYCELICEWVRIKFGVLRCIEVCGLPREKAELPNLQQFARAVVKLASDERLLRRVVDAVSCGDRDAYQSAIDELKLNDFCYVLCNWIYSIIYRRVCDVICSPVFLPVGDAITEVRATAEVMASVIKNDKALDAIGKAAEALNCEVAQSALQRAGLGPECEIICGFICSWRYVWVCRELCDFPLPFTGAHGIEEAQNFALASRQLTNQPRALADLVSAVQNRDAKAYTTIIGRFGLGPYCLQVCAWVCAITCREFCICICPGTGLKPLFQQVGNFDIYGEIDPSTGLTGTQLAKTIAMPYGGGPNFAFWQQLQLGGYCPVYSPISPGTQMKYRFFYATATTTLASAINASQTTITVVSSAGAPAAPPPSFNVSVCRPDGTIESAEIMQVTAVAGNTWTVVRGQDGTTPAAAPVGATVGINPAPINGNLVSPVQIGTHPCPVLWPTNISGIASLPLVAGVSESVWVYPPLPSPPNPPFTAPSDPAPPLLGGAWYPPIHYITPDANGWIPVDDTLIAGCVTVFLGFDTTQPGVAPGSPPLTAPPIGTPGGAPAGTAVSTADQGVGTNLSIIFQATRVTVTTVDNSNSLCVIHVNNWSEVNNLWFLEFDTPGTGCCTPIVSELSVEFTVDHEEMSAGSWSLAITNCSGSAPGNITPPNPTAGVTFTAGGRGASGTIVEDTSTWSDCSYTVTLTTQPGLTTGLDDREPIENQLTFCICGD